VQACGLFKTAPGGFVRSAVIYLFNLEDLKGHHLRHVSLLPFLCAQEMKARPGDRCMDATY